MVGANKIVDAHYDTFPSIKLDCAAAQKVAAASGKELLLSGIGETIEL